MYRIHILISDKILKKTIVVYASKLFKVYKKKGGYTQALEDFNKLVPTPTGNYGVRNNYNNNNNNNN